MWLGAWNGRLSTLTLKHHFRGVDEGLTLGQGGQLVVEVITVEKLLNRISSQHQNVLLELFILLVLPFFIDVLLVEVVLLRW